VTLAAVGNADGHGSGGYTKLLALIRLAVPAKDGHEDWKASKHPPMVI